MSKLLPEPLIISPKEARKVLGKDATQLTDEQVTEIIRGYTMLARKALQEYLVLN